MPPPPAPTPRLCKTRTSSEQEAWDRVSTRRVVGEVPKGDTKGRGSETEDRVSDRQEPQAEVTGSGGRVTRQTRLGETQGGDCILTAYEGAKGAGWPPGGV